MDRYIDKVHNKIDEIRLFYSSFGLEAYLKFNAIGVAIYFSKKGRKHLFYFFHKLIENEYDYKTDLFIYDKRLQKVEEL